MTGPRPDPVTFGQPPHPSRCGCMECASEPFTYAFMAVDGPDGLIVYTVRTTVSNEHVSRQMTVTAVAAVPLTPRLTWPLAGMVARLSLVAPDGSEVGFTSVSLAPPAVSDPQHVVVASGVWTEIPDVGIEMFHSTGEKVALTVFDGEVTGFDMRGLRVRATPPSRDYDDTYED